MNAVVRLLVASKRRPVKGATQLGRKGDERVTNTGHYARRPVAGHVLERGITQQPLRHHFGGIVVIEVLLFRVGGRQIGQMHKRIVKI